MLQEKINTAVLEQFMKTVKGAEAGAQREIRLDITTAKNIRDNLALVMTRLVGNYETLLSSKQPTAVEPNITVSMDGGDWSKN